MTGRAKAEKLSVLILSIMIMGLLCVNWWVSQFDPAASQAFTIGPKDRPLGSSAVLQAPSGLSPLSEFGETLSRPIFVASRRPYVPPKPEATVAANEPAPAPPNVLLVGIFIRPGMKQALLRSPSQPEAQWVAEGDTFNGWSLQAVHSDSVVIRARQTTRELGLYTQPAPAKGRRSDGEARPHAVPAKR